MEAAVIDRQAEKICRREDVGGLEGVTLGWKVWRRIGLPLWGFLFW
ncbi:MAG: hypothetical protein V3R82_05290 [Candidatus Hydrothermarchaeales archaeon]